MAKPTGRLQLDPSTSTGATVHVTLVASVDGPAAGFATAAGVAVSGQREREAGRARTATIATTSGQTAITGTGFQRSGPRSDVGRPITGTGIPANTYITAVASSTAATLSAAATATGTPTATIDVDGLVSIPDLHPNSGSSDDVIDDPTGSVWSLVVRHKTGPTPTPIFFTAPDSAGLFEIAENLTTEPGALPPPGAVAALEPLVTEEVAAQLEAAGAVEDAPAATSPIPSTARPLVVQNWGTDSKSLRATTLTDLAAGLDIESLANVATSRLLGRVTSGSGDSEELTAAQAWTILDDSGPASPVSWTQALTLTAAGDALTVASGTASHGKIGVGAGALGAGFGLYANTSHAEPSLVLGSALGLRFGPGGSTAVDWSLARSGSAAAAITGALSVSALLTASAGLTVSSGAVTLPAGSVANAALATNPLDLANATNPTSASAAFNSAVRASRVDQMAAATAAQTWTGALTLQHADGLTVRTSTAAQGKTQITTTAFGSGFGIYSDSGHAQPTTAVGSAFLGMGAGNAATVDWFIQRSAAATVTLTGHVAFNTSGGTQLGTGTTQLVAFHGATPIGQYATTGTSTGFTAGAGTTVTHLSTFTGNTGSTAYTIGDIVRALKLKGLIAS